ncbi:outer membrane beta-barrel family protein [Pedobacter sp. D749]|uniref:outer membrane beta-barrel family protein n=1 Tax=Pedobacter sp. D749 TaxID=2856523 RepID=UPI001C56C5B1|nr:outer membrane beta-barrel family protein [Pedobacter sp. D749]QXU43285.1 TonB-dependent receptor family protein [Pedobacter sp. D749]
MNISAKKQKLVGLSAFLTGNKLLNSLLICQLMRVSGIVIILLSTTVGVLHANSSKGQDMATEKVTIGLQYESLTTGLEKIEQQTSLRFFYRKADVKVIKSLSLPVRVRTVQETLNELLRNTFFSFRQIDGNILLEKNNLQTEYLINGRVVSINQHSIPYATVSLIQVDINKSIQTIQTDTSGNFKFTANKKGDYLVKISAMGMDSLSVAITLSDAKVIQLPDIVLTSSSTILRDVVVTASKPLIKQEIDRLTYNVQSDPEKDILSALELLRKVPLVSITGDDKIEVKGNSNFRILINGRPSSLIANNPSDVFRSMPANTIQSIEVITNPPSKYDAEGIAGIINIITNKKIEQGYNASVGAYYNTLNQRGLNSSLTLKTNKIGINGFFGSNWQDNPASTFKNSQLGTSFINTLSTEQGQMINSRNALYGNVEISYEIDSLNLITGTMGLNNSKNNQKSDQFFNLMNSQSIIEQSYHIDYSGKDNRKGNDFGINYQLGFPNKKDQLLTASYKYNESDYTENNTNIATQRFNYPNNDRGQFNNSGAKEQTIQLDYVHPLKSLNIEGGAKAILRDNYSDFTYKSFVPGSGDEVSNNTVNSFKYLNNIYGFYNTYHLKFKKWGIKAGVRLEVTTINADFITVGSKVDRTYSNLIPTIVFQRIFENQNNLTLGYTQRIQRPGIMQLNPFENKSNTLYWEAGNPDLLPVLNHNFELTYSNFKKGSLNISVNYLFANNSVQQVAALGKDSVTRYTYQNIGKNDDLGFNLNFSYTIAKGFTVNANGRISYLWLTGTSNGQFASNQGFKGNTNVSFSHFLEKYNFRTSLDFGTNSPEIYLQGKSRSSYNSSLSLNKQFFNKSLSISASVSNPFEKYRNWYTRFTTPDFTSDYNSRNNFRRFNFSVNYKFGGLKSTIKKNKRGINNDDYLK